MDFAYLESEDLLDNLKSLRNNISPYLDTHPEFYTDHSVKHSDRLCKLAAEIIEPIQKKGNAKRLNNNELFILYASCYLHDIGMCIKIKNDSEANKFAAIKNELENGSEKESRKWSELTSEDQQKIVRKVHAKLSAEIIRNSVKSKQGKNGAKLNFSPLKEDLITESIIRLCKAHTLDVSGEEYEIVENIAGVRRMLLSGILRLSDILDVSWRRSWVEGIDWTKVDRGSTSAMHWWIHQYLNNPSINDPEGKIILTYIFPSTEGDFYKRVIPPLTLPSLRDELKRHKEIFFNNGLRYEIESKYDTQLEESVIMEMPPETKVRTVNEYKRLIFNKRSYSKLHENTAEIFLNGIQKKPLVVYFDARTAISIPDSNFPSWFDEGMQLHLALQECAVKYTQTSHFIDIIRSKDGKKPDLCGAVTPSCRIIFIIGSQDFLKEDLNLSAKGRVNENTSTGQIEVSTMPDLLPLAEIHEMMSCPLAVITSEMLYKILYEVKDDLFTQNSENEFNEFKKTLGFSSNTVSTICDGKKEEAIQSLENDLLEMGQSKKSLIEGSIDFALSGNICKDLNKIILDEGWGATIEEDESSRERIIIYYKIEESWDSNTKNLEEVSLKCEIGDNFLNHKRRFGNLVFKKVFTFEKNESGLQAQSKSFNPMVRLIKEEKELEEELPEDWRLYVREEYDPLSIIANAREEATT